ncbi:E3 ubiquitin-protein ligase CCNB1IP1-like [Homarus americanus]|uniref:E3 ubiquitin-protein ligase CCNB1IP1-like n=1 Tax=Homarus americanus TaxID=6706 RepID=UPI001C44CA5E|nr:E3 ubiquitin-protein ligase CCNB1IP1-like [Homarus americanus]
MSDNQLLCNFRSCRRPLDDFAWVTFCSHIFCDNHGKPLTQTPCECSACGARLVDKTDIHRVDLEPSEQFKSMVLAGLRPSTVMEVCHRALAFWSHQMDQELNHQRHLNQKLRERAHHVHTYYEQEMRARDEHLNLLTGQLGALQRDHDKCNKQKQSLNERLSEKTRQYHKLQDLYDCLRKRTGQIRARSCSPPPGTSTAISTTCLSMVQMDGAPQPPNMLPPTRLALIEGVPPTGSLSPRKPQSYQVLTEFTFQPSIFTEPGDPSDLHGDGAPV